MFSWLKSRRASTPLGATQERSGTVAPAGAALDAFEALLESNDLAGALAASGRLPEEERKGARYLRLEGWLSYELGNLNDAEQRLEEALQLDPRDTHGTALLAGTHMRQGQMEQAIEGALQAEALGGAFPWLRSMLGVAYHRQGINERAREWFYSALDLDPARRDALDALAVMARDSREWETLRDIARRMTMAYPDDPEGWSFSGLAEARIGSDETAEKHLLLALELSGAGAISKRNLAAFLMNCGRIEEASRHLEGALQSDANNAFLHLLHAQCLLILRGSSTEAWREYEWRLRLPDVAPQTTVARWQGERIESGELLMLPEQGLGDMLLFARRLPEVVHRCEHVVLQMRPPLVSLFQSSAVRMGWRNLEVVSAETSKPRQAVRFVSFMSLMDVLGTLPPARAAPYLLPSESKEQEWRQRLGPKSARLRVALVWAGNPMREDDVLRSIPPTALAPLVGLPDVEFVSLQKDALPQYFVDLPLRLRDLSDNIRDFEDSAAVLLQCDLLISIDTAAAHLAGACGVACWVLLPLAKDWRWVMNGVDQPWYPTHRSFRVGRSREWHPVIESVAAELTRLPAQGPRAERT